MVWFVQKFISNRWLDYNFVELTRPLFGQKGIRLPKCSHPLSLFFGASTPFNFFRFEMIYKYDLIPFIYLFIYFFCRIIILDGLCLLEMAKCVRQRYTHISPNLWDWDTHTHRSQSAFAKKCLWVLLVVFAYIYVVFVLLLLIFFQLYTKVRKKWILKWLALHSTQVRESSGSAHFCTKTKHSWYYLRLMLKIFLF